MFNDWIKMEAFYYSQLPYLVIAIGAFCFILLAMISHLKNKSVRKLAILLSVGILLLGGYTLTNFQKYRALIAQSTSLTATVRLKEPHYGYTRNIRNSERSKYLNIYQPELFEPLAFYDATFIEEAINFLGKNEHRYYFEMNGHEFYVDKKWVKISNELTQAKRVGVQYQLNETKFEEIGFVPESIIYQKSFEIPHSMEDLVLSDELALKIKIGEDKIENWLMP